jgi:CheY-like chemotaxis protein
MARVLLVCWKAEEAVERARLLEGAGYEVVSKSDGREAVLAAREAQPVAVVIDYTRLPSHGRELAVTLRKQAGTRRIPLLIVGGAPEKVEALRAILPDAVYTSWERVADEIGTAIESPVSDPVVPMPNPAGYSGTPLPKKLGIRPRDVVALVGAPDDFAETLGSLPEGARLQADLLPGPNLALWFVRSQAELEGGIAGMAPACGKGNLWILWPKKSSGIVTDLSENAVREAGLAHGWVDFKVAAIDAVWSGLRFARRR